MTALGKLIVDMQELKKTKLYASSFKCIDDCLFLAEYHKKEERKQETLEEAAGKYAGKYALSTRHISHIGFEDGANWQAERGQKIVPFDAVDIEVFAIKPDEYGKLFAYIGYKITNGNFEFNVVPFTEPQAERMYTSQNLIDFVYYITSRYYSEFIVDTDAVDVFIEQFKMKVNN
jgi:hypothetical protein